MASTNADSGCIQIITYIRRNPNLTRQEFYAHWENVHGPKVIPLVEKYGCRRYQQIHTSGTMVPVPSAASAPNATAQQELPKEPVEYDGIALFLVPSLEHFTDMFKDPYFFSVVRPDEEVLIDTKGIGGGIVASFSGKMLSVTHDGRNAIGERGDEYRQLLRDSEEEK